jgi:hypothetical protein
MADDNSAANSKKIHDDNSAKVVAQVTANAARAAMVPSLVGRTGPGLDPTFMQGTANRVVPNAFVVTR